ncbi:translation initiation factor IF-2 subunit alpha [Candidatus Woesearchaeota archaeon]|nr:translation initiation factor IF-2 subunit alpha [Candidatus Woesearchaeota archaeon]
MLLKKQGYPEESEIVLCTVTSVRYNSVFANLNEYDHSGMIHISEISPGRIRNINDYVKEGKVVICKVLRIYKERGYIDLSLRRVNEGQRRAKVNEIKKEQKAEKIIEFVAKKLKKDVKDIYKEISDKVFKRYDLLYPCFEDVSEKKINLEEIDIPKKLAEELKEVIKQKIKPVEVNIKGNIKLVSYASDGVEIIKDAIKRGMDKNIKILYVGGGKYNIKVKASDYKAAEKILKDSTEAIIQYAEKNDVKASFEREEK